MRRNKLVPLCFWPSVLISSGCRLQVMKTFVAWLKCPCLSSATRDSFTFLPNEWTSSRPGWGWIHQLLGPLSCLLDENSSSDTSSCRQGEPRPLLEKPFVVIFEEGWSGAPPGRLPAICRLEDGLLSTQDVPWRLKAMPFTYKLQWSWCKWATPGRFPISKIS